MAKLPIKSIAQIKLEEALERIKDKNGKPKKPKRKDKK